MISNLIISGGSIIGRELERGCNYGDAPWGTLVLGLLSPHHQLMTTRLTGAENL